MSIRLAIIDDHPLVVDGLKASLRTTGDIELVAVAATVSEAYEVLRREDIDVVTLDVRLEGGNGLQLLADRGQRRRPFVLVLSSFETAQYLAAAARYGASGYLLKTAPLAELVEAIRSVAGNGTVFTNAQLRAKFVTLSSRERDVVRLVADGLTNKEIADRLGMSRKGIEFHLSSIFTRFGIRAGRVELANRVRDEGWLEIEGPADAG
jgi:DNA-binding NarL/FixJ family response regulator